MIKVYDASDALAMIAQFPEQLVGQDFFLLVLSLPYPWLVSFVGA
jgi:hypothetical protein